MTYTVEVAVKDAQGLPTLKTETTIDPGEVKIIIQDWIEEHLAEDKGYGLAMLLDWDERSKFKLKNSGGEFLLVDVSE